MDIRPATHEFWIQIHSENPFNFKPVSKAAEIRKTVPEVAKTEQTSTSKSIEHDFCGKLTLMYKTNVMEWLAYQFKEEYEDDITNGYIPRVGKMYNQYGSLQEIKRKMRVSEVMSGFTFQGNTDKIIIAHGEHRRSGVMKCIGIRRCEKRPPTTRRRQRPETRNPARPRSRAPSRARPVPRVECMSSGHGGAVVLVSRAHSFVWCVTPRGARAFKTQAAAAA